MFNKNILIFNISFLIFLLMLRIMIFFIIQRGRMSFICDRICPDKTLILAFINRCIELFMKTFSWFHISLLLNSPWIYSLFTNKNWRFLFRCYCVSKNSYRAFSFRPIRSLRKYSWPYFCFERTWTRRGFWSIVFSDIWILFKYLFSLRMVSGGTFKWRI